MIGDYKIVDFHKFCPLCINKDKNDDEDPCRECLSSPGNIDSRRPVKHEFSEQGKKIFDEEVAMHKNH